MRIEKAKQEKIKDIVQISKGHLNQMYSLEV